MLIENTIKRPKGSSVTMEGIKYDFQPEEEGGPHICEVENMDHALRLLSIKAYQPVNSGKDSAKYLSLVKALDMKVLEMVQSMSELKDDELRAMMIIESRGKNRREVIGIVQLMLDERVKTNGSKPPNAKRTSSTNKNRNKRPAG